MPIFERQSQSGDLLISFETTDLVMAGWAGRDMAAVRHHIEELEAIGVTPPSKTPLFYRVDPALLVANPEQIRVVGEATSGEVEAVILAMADGLWVGLGSDHTDRALESTSVQLAKQLCRKPMAGTVWSYSDVRAHWDELILRSYIIENGERVLYQEGALANLQHPDDLMTAYRSERGFFDSDLSLPEGSALFCGTLPAIGGIRSSTNFEMELEDPVSNRSLRHQVLIETLPEVS